MKNMVLALCIFCIEPNLFRVLGAIVMMCLAWTIMYRIFYKEHRERKLY